MCEKNIYDKDVNWINNRIYEFTKISKEY
jgi:hypothetical protein